MRAQRSRKIPWPPAIERESEAQSPSWIANSSVQGIYRFPDNVARFADTASRSPDITARFACTVSAKTENLLRFQTLLRIRA
jgi:hypothetical protein